MLPSKPSDGATLHGLAMHGRQPDPPLTGRPGLDSLAVTNRSTYPSVWTYCRRYLRSRMGTT
jgi:hypothetical protein